MNGSGISRRSPYTRKNYVKTRLVLFSLLTLTLLLGSLFARQLCPYDPNEQNYDKALMPPCIEHPFGTDRYGRDMLSRVIIGSRVSIFATLALVGTICAAGTAAGVACGFAGGRLDAAVMRVSDVCLAFPGLVFALAIAAVLGGGGANAVAALAVISWPKYSRIARSQTLALKRSDFIAAARLSGCTSAQIIVRHILPNIMGPVVVTAMLDIGTMMMELAGLSFLGLGAMPPTAEWGNMMSGGRSMLQTYPWVVITPGIAIFISVVLFNMLGDAVRDWLDPRGTK